LQGEDGGEGKEKSIRSGDDDGDLENENENEKEEKSECPEWGGDDWSSAGMKSSNDCIDNTGETCPQRKRRLRTFHGGTGKTRMRACAVEAIKSFMSKHGTNRIQIQNVKSTRSGPRGDRCRDVNIARLKERKPIVSIKNISQERTNDNYRTVRFNERVVFPPSIFLSLCVPKQ
jgi:hypothetical protein